MAEPDPTKPSGPTEPTESSSGSGGGGEGKCRADKKRKSRIVRVYSDDKGKPPVEGEKNKSTHGGDQPRGPGTPVEGGPPPGFGQPQPGGGQTGGGGGGGGDSDKPSTTATPERPKCSKSGKFWVDIEVIGNAAFKGVQWRGPATGNQPQETIWKPSDDYTGHQGTDITSIKIKKDKDDKSGENKDKQPDADDVPLRNKRCSKMATAGAYVERSFKNEGDDKSDSTKGNSCRQKSSFKRRVRSNPVEKEHLKLSDKTGKRDQPPSNPKKYKDAVKKSMAQQDAGPDGGPPLWLRIEIEKHDREMRARQLRQQGINRKDIFNGGRLDMPGSEKSKGDGLKEPHIRLDPYQKIVNFGPDGLAVEFTGTGAAGGGGGGGGDLGGAFGGIAGGLLGGASAKPAG